MSRYSGPQGRGASRLVRELKQDQAEARNAHYREQRELADRFANQDKTKAGAEAEIVNALE